MRKTLSRLAILGAALGSLVSSGCQGQRLGGEIALGVGVGMAHGYADQKARNYANRQDNVNQGQTVYIVPQQAPQTNVPPYKIDENLLDGSEKDKKEARAVYKVLMLTDYYNKKASSSQESAKQTATISTQGCPEGFKKVFEEFVKEINNNGSGIASMTTWNKIFQEALKEGVMRQ